MARRVIWVVVVEVVVGTLVEETRNICGWDEREGALPVGIKVREPASRLVVVLMDRTVSYCELELLILDKVFGHAPLSPK